MLISRDCAGHVEVLILFISYLLVKRDLKTGTLSSWKTYFPCGKHLTIKGHKYVSNTSIYFSVDFAFYTGYCPNTIKTNLSPYHSRKFTFRCTYISCQLHRAFAIFNAVIVTNFNFTLVNKYSIFYIGHQSANFSLLLHMKLVGIFSFIL